MATLKLGDFELCEIERNGLIMILNIAITANNHKLEQLENKSIKSLTHWDSELEEFVHADLNSAVSEMEFFIKRREKLNEIKTNLDLMLMNTAQ